MKHIKDELQSIIVGNGQDGCTSQLKKVHDFLRGNATTGSKPEEQKYLKSEEEQLLIEFSQKENLTFSGDISGTMITKTLNWVSFLKIYMMKTFFAGTVYFIL